MLGKTAFAVLAVAGAVAVTACSTGSGEKGSGTEGSEARELPPFSAVEVSGQADAVVRIGEPRKVTVRGDDNLLEQVKTEVSGDTLEVSQDEDIDPDLGITVEVRIPATSASSGSSPSKPRLRCRVPAASTFTPPIP